MNLAFWGKLFKTTSLKKIKVVRKQHDKTKIPHYFFIVALLITNQPILANAQTQDKNNCQTVKFALIASLMPSVDQTLEKIYKRPTQWAGYETEVLDIKQLHGVGDIGTLGSVPMSLYIPVLK